MRIELGDIVRINPDALLSDYSNNSRTLEFPLSHPLLCWLGVVTNVYNVGVRTAPTLAFAIDWIYSPQIGIDKLKPDQNSHNVALYCKAL